MKSGIVFRCIFYGLATVALLSSCEKQSGDSNVSPAATVPRGTIVERGLQVKLVEKRRIQLASDGPGFLIRLASLVYRQNRFYALSAKTPEIVVFDSAGGYVETIRFEPIQKRICNFKNLRIDAAGHFFLQDIQNSAILELDATGRQVWMSSTAGTDNNIAPAELVVLGHQDNRIILSSIFQWFRGQAYDPEGIMRKTLLIGRFQPGQGLVDRFVRHSPTYVEYYLEQFPKVSFAVYKHEIYVLEQPLPHIRVYSIDGELRRTFGETGLHQRAVTRMPKNLGGYEPYKRSFAYSWFHDIYLVNDFDQYGDMIAVVYQNPQKKNEKSNLIISDWYMMLYTPEGELLLNDMVLPGMPRSVRGKTLVIEIGHEPDNRVIGLYELAVISSSDASSSRQGAGD